MFRMRAAGQIIIALVAIAAVAQEPAPPASVSSSSPAELLFTATDNKGRAVAGLQPDSLQLRVDGMAVAIDEVRSVKTDPVFYVLLIDVSGSSRDKVRHLRDYSADVIRALNVGSNKGLVALFNDKLGVLSSYADESAVEAIDSSTMNGQTALFDAIYEMCTLLDKRSDVPPAARRVVIPLTDGVDSVSRHTLQEAATISLRTRVALFPIGLLNADDAYQGKRNLETLADRTGGRSIILRQPSSFIGKFNELLSSQYALRFQSTSLGSDRHELKIEVTGDRKLKISAPDGYFAR